jgi:hypothetical protein
MPTPTSSSVFYHHHRYSPWVSSWEASRKGRVESSSVARGCVGTDVRTTTTTDGRASKRTQFARVVVVVEPLIYSDMWVLM